MNYVIAQVDDLKAAWGDFEPLITGIIDFHRPWDGRPLQDEWSHHIREYMESVPERLTLLARDDSGQPIAFIDGAITRSDSIFSEVFAFINNIFVVEGARGDGVGKELLERFKTWAAESGATEVRLHVNAGNAQGQKFWIREGFKTYEHAMRLGVGPT